MVLLILGKEIKNFLFMARLENVFTFFHDISRPEEGLSEFMPLPIPNMTGPGIINWQGLILRVIRLCRKLP